LSFGLGKPHCGKLRPCIFHVRFVYAAVSVYSSEPRTRKRTSSDRANIRNFGGSPDFPEADLG